jgi:hypothetical protein
MLDDQIFFGFSFYPEEIKNLRIISNIEYDYFLQDGSVCCIQYEGNTYIGKYLGDYANTSAIDLLEKHIYSVIQRLIPNFSLGMYSLSFFLIPLFPSLSKEQL